MLPEAPRVAPFRAALLVLAALLLHEPARAHQLDTPVDLIAPWPAGRTLIAGGPATGGAFWGDEPHVDYLQADGCPEGGCHINDHYAVDWNLAIGPGEDCNNEEGVRLLAPADGVVTDTVPEAESGGAGNVLYLRLAADPTVTLHFYHMRSFALVEGAVRAGDDIGRIGRSATECAHLHLGARKAVDGESYSIPYTLEGQPLTPDIAIRSSNRRTDQQTRALAAAIATLESAISSLAP